MSFITFRTILFANYIFIPARRIVKHAISSTDDTIDAFCKVFIELEKAFHTGMAVQTEIVTIRILDKVEHVLDGVEHILDHTEKISTQTQRPIFDM